MRSLLLTEDDEGVVKLHPFGSGPRLSYTEVIGLVEAARVQARCNFIHAQAAAERCEPSKESEEKNGEEGTN